MILGCKIEFISKVVSLKTVFTSAVTSALLATAPALAGDSNTVVLLQDANSGPGNTLFIDQSLATGSLLAGAPNALKPATQIGGGNMADIDLEGEGAAVFLTQNNSMMFNALGNEVSVFGGDLSNVVISQIGSGNQGTVEVPGEGSLGVLRQFGNDNLGNVSVSGENSLGSLNQIGNRNSWSLDVSGDSTRVFAAQIGNDFSTLGGAGLEVFSNGVTVNITTTTLP